MKQKPLFITFEGCEGSGKSTQAKILIKWLNEHNLVSFFTREPGGTQASEELRKILLNGSIKLQHKSELLLHTCARLEHVENIIKPQLAENKIVICDRYMDSSRAYQGYGNHIPMDVIDKLHELIIGKFYPDLTFILDINVATLRRRISRRQNVNDRYENKDDSYHERVAAGYREIAAKYPDRCVLIDASQTIDKIHQVIIQKITALLSV